jgi:hypothetical protein
MEFRNSIDTTGVNIPAKVVDYVIKVGTASRARRLEAAFGTDESLRSEERRLEEIATLA